MKKIFVKDYTKWSKHVIEEISIRAPRGIVFCFDDGTQIEVNYSDDDKGLEIKTSGNMLKRLVILPSLSNVVQVNALDL